jgi:hypothetical protein
MGALVAGHAQGKTLFLVNICDADRYLIDEGQVVVGADLGTALGGIGLNALADGPSGGCWFWPGRHRPGTVAAIGSDVCLAERNSQQARAQEHEAGRGQGKKSVGDDVVVAHVTPTTQILARIY